MPVSVLTTDDFKPKGLLEARRIFERKAVLSSEKFAALSHEQRALAFSVWQVNEAKLIQRVRNSIRMVIDGRKTYREMRNELQKLLGLDGFSPGVMQRIRILYRQNALTAYSVARRAVLEEPVVREAFPFWQYKTVGDGSPGKFGVRRDHAALHDKVFRIDDPIWRTIYPPWGWGCRCFVIPLTPGMVKSQRLSIADGGSQGASPEETIRSPSALFDRDTFDTSDLDADLRASLKRLHAELGVT
ncbi:MAG TPA: hypothetical protein ENI79_02120 [Rhodospirillales bacterium]|nr:hypothetical protein [Rhodospirillales bacterium]